MDCPSADAGSFTNCARSVGLLAAEDWCADNLWLRLQYLHCQQRQADAFDVALLAGAFCWDGPYIVLDVAPTHSGDDAVALRRQQCEADEVAARLRDITRSLISLAFFLRPAGRPDFSDFVVGESALALGGGTASHST